VKVESPPSVEVSADRRAVIVRKWLARTLETYPEQTSRFLLREKDPFRNPVGHALADGLPLLLDEILGNADAARITPVLDSIIRIRAVQDFTASQAVAFLFLLKDILREEAEAGALAAMNSRIDEIALSAFDLYMKCREQMHEIKVNEAKRRVFLLERIGLRSP
jgi:hypothetical protein